MKTSDILAHSELSDQALGDVSVLGELTCNITLSY